MSPEEYQEIRQGTGIFSKGGITTTNFQGGLPGYGTVWFHPGVIANILSHVKGVRKYWVDYNSTRKNKFLLYLTRGEVVSFTQCDRGILYSNMAVGEGMVLFNTVDHNKYNYYERDYSRDLLAHKLQYKNSLPSHRHLVIIVEDKVQILNCPLN